MTAKRLRFRKERSLCCVIIHGAINLGAINLGAITGAIRECRQLRTVTNPAIRMKGDYEITTLSLLLLPLLAGAAAPLAAQDVGRVSPASLPLPLPASAPMPPNLLRAQNPWNLPMTGAWKFKLTYGEIKAGKYQPAAPPQTAISALNSQAENPPENAFDGKQDTRWCATGASFPQWLQADLGKPQRVSGAEPDLGIRH